MVSHCLILVFAGSPSGDQYRSTLSLLVFAERPNRSTSPKAMDGVLEVKPRGRRGWENQGLIGPYRPDGPRVNETRVAEKPE